MKRMDKMIVVTDDWYPCFPGNKVRVSLIPLSYRGKDWIRVCAWGADDTGYERDFSKYSLGEAVYVYENIFDGVNKLWFINNGFVRA